MFRRYLSAMTLPTFLIIGAAKAGTTALYQYLDEHPRVYMSPQKETNFFALEGEKPAFSGPPGQPVQINHRAITRIEDYGAQFRGRSTETAIGEASPFYLYSPKAPGRIKSRLQHAKLIAILRNPADRAYSALTMMRLNRREPIASFEAALRAEEARIAGGWEFIWHYKQQGFYYPQLKRYYDLFDERQLRIYLTEDLSASPMKILRDIFHFLEVDALFVPDISQRHQLSGVPKSKLFHRILTDDFPLRSTFRNYLPQKFRKRLKNRLISGNLARAPMAPATRRRLLNLYEEDILRTQELTGRNLSRWLR